MPKIVVDHTACVRCGACIDVCSAAHVFAMGEQGSEPVRAEKCWGCGQCVAACPTDAIDHETFPLEECPLIEPGSLPDWQTMQTALRARRSVRTYDKRPVPRERVREIVTSAQSAPTARNNQALDWIALDDRARITELGRATVARMQQLVRWAENPVTRPAFRIAAGREAAHAARAYARTVRRLARELDHGNDPIFHHAPVVLIGHAVSGNPFGRDDAIYATYNMMLAAERYGLGTCQIGFFQMMVERSPKLARSLALPEGRVPQVAFTLGYPRYPYRRMVPRRIPNLAWNPR